MNRKLNGKTQEQSWALHHHKLKLLKLNSRPAKNFSPFAEEVTIDLVRKYLTTATLLALKLAGESSLYY